MSRLRIPPHTRLFSLVAHGAIGLLLLALAHPASAQGPMDRVAAFGERASGFNQVGGIRTDILQTGEDGAVYVRLQEGSSYMVAGFCEDACQNLDLLLVDAGGEILQADDLPDAEPVLMFTAETSGIHEVRVVMATCSAADCGYAVGVFAAAGSGRSQFVQGMDERLEGFRRKLAGEGFVPVGEVMERSLGHLEEMQLPVRLRGGLEYRIVGVCDEDCVDLDMVLMDRSEREITFDIEPDPIPTMAYIPAQDEEVLVNVTMVACGAEPCLYRVALFARTEDTAPSRHMVLGVVVEEGNDDGVLTPQDPKLPTGEHFHEYTLEAMVGQTIVLSLRSVAFDTHLILETPGGQRVTSDEFSRDRGLATITLVAPVQGTYKIFATSASPDSTGRYILLWSLVEGS